MDLLDNVMPKVGDRIARYEITQELGRGGFGVVYKARQAGLEADVAIKLLIPQLSGQAQQMQLLERFEQEARVIKQLEHSAALKVRDYGRWNGLPYLVTEFVRGTTLEDILPREAPLHPARIVRIMGQVLGCLAEAHHHQIIHRDLKPANLMLRDIVGESDAVKVLDFGIAKVGSAGGVQTMTGMRFGTPWYMAPEQCRGLSDLDGRVDVYAVGLIMGECLTGRKVVQATDMMGAFYAQANRDPLAFEPIVEQSPLWPVIQGATQKEREHRYPDALTMRRALEALMGGGSYGHLPAQTPAAAFAPPATLITPMPSVSTGPASAAKPGGSGDAPRVAPAPVVAPAWPPSGRISTPMPSQAGAGAASLPSHGGVDAGGSRTAVRLGAALVGLAALVVGALLLFGSEGEPTPAGEGTDRPVARVVGGGSSEATELAVTAGLLHARFESNVPGFDVLVDGERIATTETTSLELDLPPDGVVETRRFEWVVHSSRSDRASDGSLNVRVEWVPLRSYGPPGFYVESTGPGGEPGFYLALDPLPADVAAAACRADCMRPLVEAGDIRTWAETEALDPELRCSADCLLGASPGACEGQLLNCLSQDGAAAVCQVLGGRLPTAPEAQRARQSGLLSTVWHWTSTADEREPDKAIVFGGPTMSTPPTPDEVSEDRWTARVRRSATPPFMGVRCVLDVERMLEVIRSDPAVVPPARTDACARFYERSLDCLTQRCATNARDERCEQQALLAAYPWMIRRDEGRCDEDVAAARLGLACDELLDPGD